MILISFDVITFTSCYCIIMTTLSSSFFFFNDTATTEIYTLSLHDALPIYSTTPLLRSLAILWTSRSSSRCPRRSEEHTSELQSQFHLVCRLLLEKKKKKHPQTPRA